MVPSFDIRSTNDPSAQTHLLAEIGQQGISFTIREGGGRFSTVVCYHFQSGNDIAAQLQDILAAEPLLQQPFSKTDIVWSFAESVLVPHEYYNSSHTQQTVELIYGDAGHGEIRTDFLFRYNVHNVYRVPVAVAAAVASKFPYANQSHLYSLLPDMTEKTGNRLLAIFHPKQLTAALMHEGDIQAIQTFAFDNSRDAAYYLLSLCDRFGAAPGEVQVHLKGMIDERSNLYSELYKYFLNLRFDPLPDGFEYADGVKEHPGHFFSHLFATAACV